MYLTYSLFFLQWIKSTLTLCSWNTRMTSSLLNPTLSVCDITTVARWCEMPAAALLIRVCAFFATAAQANIWGPEDVYVKKGSTISLTCSINVHSTPPGSVLWYHGASVVDFDSPRGGISLETEKTESGTTSKLLVTKAALTDSGNYTCVPSNANPASVWVHVLNGEFSLILFSCPLVSCWGDRWREIVDKLRDYEKAFGVTAAPV
jgi:hypothetical protein